MQRKDRTGETNVNKIGLNMTIIKYRYANDIDIRFDDGSIVEHKYYSHFKSGSVLHPSQNIHDSVSAYAKRKSRRYKNKYIGQKKAMNCGNTCEITEYESSKKITVTFEKTGSTVTTSLKRFREGSIQDPDLDVTQLTQNRQKRLGRKTTAECGMEMTVTAYRSSNDIDVTFQDGTKVEKRSYSEFRDGHIIHPLYPAKKASLYERTTRIGHVDRKTIAYVTDRPNYYCTCTACGHSDIWDWKEIRRHNDMHEREEHNG